jgi:hypothetical protein
VVDGDCIGDSVAILKVVTIAYLVGDFDRNSMEITASIEQIIGVVIILIYVLEVGGFGGGTVPDKIQIVMKINHEGEVNRYELETESFKGIKLGTVYSQANP